MYTYSSVVDCHNNTEGWINFVTGLASWQWAATETKPISLGTEQSSKTFTPPPPPWDGSRPIHLHPVADNVQCDNDLEDKQEVRVEDTEHHQEETGRKPARNKGGQHTQTVPVV